MRKSSEEIEKEIRDAIEEKQPSDVDFFALNQVLLKLEALAIEQGTVDYLDIAIHEMGAFYALGIFSHNKK